MNNLIWAAAISFALVWVVPAFLKNIGAMIVWLEAKKAQLEAEMDAIEGIGGVADELTELREQLDLFYDQLYDLQTSIKLGRFDVAEERVAQILHELEGR